MPEGKSWKQYWPPAPYTIFRQASNKNQTVLSERRNSCELQCVPASSRARLPEHADAIDDEPDTQAASTQQYFIITAVMTDYANQTHTAP